jgi:hypothetical protein
MRAINSPCWLDANDIPTHFGMVVIAEFNVRDDTSTNGLLIFDAVAVTEFDSEDNISSIGDFKM